MTRQTLTAMIAAATVFLAGTGVASAQDNEVSFYIGSQSAPHSMVDYDDGVNPVDTFRAGWDGRSFEFPIYYGFRYTRWMGNGWGFGVEMNHAKVYADDQTLTDSGFDDLEFTDGLNIVTANAIYRWEDTGGMFTPYAGAGIGLSIPHVDVTSPTTQRAFGYQVTGMAATIIVGASYALTDEWSVFGEYKGTYSMNDADLGGGESISTNIVTNALNLGVAFSF